MDWLERMLSPVNRILNRLLAVDPQMSPRMAPLAGRRLAVVIADTPVRLSITFEDGGLWLGLWDEATQPADATIRGSALSLLALARDPLGGGDRVSFSGDLGFVRDVRQLLATLDIDPEELLSRVIGDDMAHQTGATGRRLIDWLRAGGEAATSGVAEYLTEEARLLPTDAEATAYLSAIDTLREDADRLEARIRRLERRRDGSRGGA